MDVDKEDGGEQSVLTDEVEADAVTKKVEADAVTKKAEVGFFMRFAKSAYQIKKLGGKAMVLWYLRGIMSKGMLL